MIQSSFNFSQFYHSTTLKKIHIYLFVFSTRSLHAAGLLCNYMHIHKIQFLLSELSQQVIISCLQDIFDFGSRDQKSLLSRMAENTKTSYFENQNVLAGHAGELRNLERVYLRILHVQTKLFISFKVLHRYIES